MGAPDTGPCSVFTGWKGARRARAQPATVVLWSGASLTQKKSNVGNARADERRSAFTISFLSYPQEKSCLVSVTCVQNIWVG